MKRAPQIAIVGFSGAGKTTLLERLLPALLRRGLTVAAIKHTGHHHDYDRPGKDSSRLRAAGARAVFIEGQGTAAYFGPVPPRAVIALLLSGVDLVLIEGGASLRVPKIEVHRKAMRRPFLCRRDRSVFLLVSDAPAPRPIPTLAATEVEAIAECIVARLKRRRAGRRVQRPRRGGAAAPPAARPR